MKNYKSKAEFVYDALKKSIVSGEWQPGERRNADEIANVLEVSRTPVIAASKLLETEGLLVILPQVGLEVPRVTKNGIEEIFYIRGALSGLATQHACQYLSQDELIRLEDLVMSMDQTVVDRDYKKFSKLGREFHYQIFRNCNLPHLIVLIGRYWDSGNRYARFFKDMPEVMDSSQKIHHEILDSLKRHDKTKARFFAEKDSVDFGLAVARYLEKMGMSSVDVPIEN